MRHLDNKNIIGRRLRDRSNVGEAQLFSSENQVAILSFDDEPKTFEQAIKSENHKQWEQAMDDEFNLFIENSTWNSVNKPKDKKVIDNRWVNS